MDQPPQAPETLRELFRGDDHTPWYLPPKVQDSEAAGTQEQDGNKSSQTGESLSNGGDEPRNGFGFFAAMEQTRKDVAQWMQMDLETFSRLQGDQSRALTRNLRAVNREKFDYVYYTYGLKLYRNMPLIEPLEYREDFTKVIIE